MFHLDPFGNGKAGLEWGFHRWVIQVRGFGSDESLRLNILGSSTT